MNLRRVFALFLAATTLAPLVAFNSVFSLNRELGLIEAMEATKDYNLPIGILSVIVVVVMLTLLHRDTAMTSRSKLAWLIGLILIWPIIAPVLAIKLLWHQPVPI